MIPAAALDSAARLLAADTARADHWPHMPEHLRDVWRRRVDLVLRQTGGER